jgi:hypothetical protein
MNIVVVLKPSYFENTGLKEIKPCSFGLKKVMIMKNNPCLVGLMVCSMTMIGQTEKKESNKESWYFKAVDLISHKLPQPNFQ